MTELLADLLDSSRCHACDSSEVGRHAATLSGIGMPGMAAGLPPGRAGRCDVDKVGEVKALVWGSGREITVARSHHRREQIQLAVLLRGRGRGRGRQGGSCQR